MALYASALARLEGVSDGAAVQGVRERGARQERPDARQAALPLQGVRAQLHRHAAARHAAGGQGRRGAALRERAVDEPHRQAARRLDAHGPGLARAVRRGSRQETRAGGPGARHRARRDVALPEKNPRSSGSGKLGIVLQGGSWTGNAAVAIELPWSGSSAA